jgi:hypothetical protein
VRGLRGLGLGRLCFSYLDREVERGRWRREDLTVWECHVLYFYVEECVAKVCKIQLESISAALPT